MYFEMYHKTLPDYHRPVTAARNVIPKQTIFNTNKTTNIP
jgi:hypothetical protein